MTLCHQTHDALRWPDTGGSKLPYSEAMLKQREIRIPVIRLN